MISSATQITSVLLTVIFTPNTPPNTKSEGNGGNTQGGWPPLWRTTLQQAPQQPSLPLEEFGINITDIARRGDIDPVIGRRENHSCHRNFNRRTKNNPRSHRWTRCRWHCCRWRTSSKIVDAQNSKANKLSVSSAGFKGLVSEATEERMQLMEGKFRQRVRMLSYYWRNSWNRRSWYAGGFLWMLETSLKPALNQLSRSNNTNE